MRQCMFIHCHKHTSLVRVLRVGEVVHVWGQGVYGNSLYLLLSFAMNLKLL